MTRIEAIVEGGEKRGKRISFPTLNMSADQNNLEDGIYISETEIEGQWLPSVTFIGKAITFDDPVWRVETHILDFSRDLYGQKIAVQLLKKIRENEKFPSTTALIQQIEVDIVRAREYFFTHQAE